MSELMGVRTYDDKSASHPLSSVQVQKGMMTQRQRVSSPSRAATMRFDRVSQILGDLAGLKGVAAKYTASTLLKELSGFNKEDIDKMSDEQKRHLLEQAKATYVALKKLLPISEHATELMAKLEGFSQIVEGSVKRSEQASASPRSAAAPPKVPDSASLPVTLTQQAAPPLSDRAQLPPPPFMPLRQAPPPDEGAPSPVDQSRQKRAEAQANLKTLQSAIGSLADGQKLRFEGGRFKPVRRGFFPSRAGTSTASNTAAKNLVTLFEKINPLHLSMEEREQLKVYWDTLNNNTWYTATSNGISWFETRSTSIGSKIQRSLELEKLDVRDPPVVSTKKILKLYQDQYSPRQNRLNLEHYLTTPDFTRHAASARVYYNSRQLSQKDAQRVVTEREPTNLAMIRHYEEDALQEVCGHRTSVFCNPSARREDGSKFSEAPNTACLYSETYLWNPPGGDKKKELAVLSLPAPALDTPTQPHYNYYVREGKLDTAKYEEETRLLFETARQALKDNKKTAFEGRGIKRVFVTKFGQGAFLEGLKTPEEKKAARAIFSRLYKEYARKIQEEEGVEVVLNEFKEPSEREAGITYVIGDVKEQTQTGDLVLNAWDPHSVPGNGNEGDPSVDGQLGRSTAILLTQTPQINPRLREASAYVEVPSREAQVLRPSTQK